MTLVPADAPLQLPSLVVFALGFLCGVSLFAAARFIAKRYCRRSRLSALYATVDALNVGRQAYLVTATSATFVIEHGVDQASRDEAKRHLSDARDALDSQSAYDGFTLLLPSLGIQAVITFDAKTGIFKLHEESL